MNKRIKSKARSFLNEYRLGTVTLGDLRRIITSQGYTIVEFNHIFNDEATTSLIEALDLEDVVQKSKGFTFADRHRRIVFLHEDLSEKEKLLVLAHEEGHIYCDHLSSVPIIGKDVVEEHEANEFTHYILNRSQAQSFMKKHKKPCIVVGALLISVAVGVLVAGSIAKERSYYGEYFITSSGNRYHESKCIFVKDKTNVRRMTIEEFESGDYEPCGICLPQV